MDNLTLLQFLKDVNQSAIRKQLIPMEMASGWPYVSIKNAQPCITVPYFRTQRAQEGKVLLFPIAYTMTFLWPNQKLVEFADLRFKKEYRSLNFGKPLGVFKHEAVNALTQSEYETKRNELFSRYDELISGIQNKESFLHTAEMRELFRVLMEPSMYPQYLTLCAKFFQSYCDLKTEARE